MKRTFTFRFSQVIRLVLFIVLSTGAGVTILQGQISGVKNIPGDYVDLAAAINDLNTQGVGAGGSL